MGQYAVLGSILVAAMLVTAAFVVITNSDERNECDVAVTMGWQKEMVDTLTQGNLHTVVLLPPNTSPHDTNIPPSALQYLINAQLFVEIGSGIEFEDTLLERIGNDLNTDRISLAALIGAHLHDHDDCDCTACDCGAHCHCSDCSGPCHCNDCSGGHDHGGCCGDCGDGHDHGTCDCAHCHCGTHCHCNDCSGHCHCDNCSGGHEHNGCNCNECTCGDHCHCTDCSGPCHCNGCGEGHLHEGCGCRHIWTNPDNLILMAKALAAELKEAFPDIGDDVIDAGLAEYIDKVNGIKAIIVDIVGEKDAGQTILTWHNAWGLLMEYINDSANEMHGSEVQFHSDSPFIAIVAAEPQGGGTSVAPSVLALINDDNSVLNRTAYMSPFDSPQYRNAVISAGFTIVEVNPTATNFLDQLHKFVTSLKYTLDEEGSLHGDDGCDCAACDCGAHCHCKDCTAGGDCHCHGCAGDGGCCGDCGNEYTCDCAHCQCGDHCHCKECGGNHCHCDNCSAGNTCDCAACDCGAHCHCKDCTAGGDCHCHGCAGDGGCCGDCGNEPVCVCTDCDCGIDCHCLECNANGHCHCHGCTGAVCCDG